MTVLHDLADPALNSLVRATAPPGSPAHDVWLAERGNPAPPGLLARARQHDVVLSAASALLAREAHARWEEATTLFADEARTLTLRALAVTAELVRLTRLFAQAGLPFFSLKGPALSQEIFGSPAMRDPGDLDLLVRPEDLLAADDVLAKAGYRREPRWQADFAGGDLRRPLRRVFHFQYHHPGLALTAEIHWRWFHIEEVAPFDPALAWRATRRIPLGGTAVPVLSQPVQLVYLAFHAAKHACERLKWLNDLAWLMRDAGDADWAEAGEIAGRLDILDLFAAPLIAAARLGTATLPGPLAAASGRPGANRLAVLFVERIGRPSRRSGIGSFRQKLDWQRTYWRLAAHRRNPVRLRLLGRFARNLLAGG
jgi:hypothetical protein